MLKKVICLSQIIICIFISSIWAKPVENLDEYLIILVHGIGNPKDHDSRGIFVDQEYGRFMDYLREIFGYNYVASNVHCFNFTMPCELFYNIKNGNDLAKELGKRNADQAPAEV